MVTLSKEFIKWIVLTIIIAFPISYFVTIKWLEKFAYKIELGIWIFIIPDITTLIIVLITVSYHILKAAHVNPIDSIKYK